MRLVGGLKIVAACALLAVTSLGVTSAVRARTNVAGHDRPDANPTTGRARRVPMPANSHRAATAAHLATTARRVRMPARVGRRASVLRVTTSIWPRHSPSAPSARRKSASRPSASSRKRRACAARPVPGSKPSWPTSRSTDPKPTSPATSSTAARSSASMSTRHSSRPSTPASWASCSTTGGICW